MSGTLFVVATPIGNLEDITLRALRVLKEVALVAAEDTRRTGNLLRHYDIHTPLLSLHEHNEGARAPKLIHRLMQGESVALVTDAGTPGISDPGAQLVAAVRSAGLRVEPVPGPSAVIAAISAAGVKSDGFEFAGFAPIKAKARKQWFERLLAHSRDRAVVFFEAPHKLQRTLQELSLLVKRPIFAARELTKLHEELVTGTPMELIRLFNQPIGEFTLVVPPGSDELPDSPAITDSQIHACFGQMADSTLSRSKRDSARLVAEQLNLSTKRVYDALERVKLGELKKEPVRRG
jgi:16S rRNA (cytidine1402-2'-O)-methyltransferase